MFAIGFLGWYLVNIFAWSHVPAGGYGLGVFFVFAIMLPFNIVALIVLGIIRSTRWVALGIVTALALNFLISLALGLTLNAQCLIPFFEHVGS
jgi:hypothetical protein